MSKHKMLEQLRTAADEFRVKMHLAGMDAKSAWEKLEPKLHEFERRVEGAADTIGDELVSAGEELKADLDRLTKKVSGSKAEKPGS